MCRYRYVLFLLIVCFFTSCRSSKKIAEIREIPNITESKLYSNIYDSELEYSSLYSKKMDVTFIENKKKNSLGGSLKIAKDEFIWMNLTAPLGIEVARLLITPDSVKFLDSHNKRYWLASYNDIYEKYGLSFSYSCLQNILSNAFFNLETCIDDEVKTNKFVFNKVVDGYELSNVHERAINRKVKKFYKKQRKHKDFTLILQKINIHPDYFRPQNILLKDMEDDMELTVNYGDFKYFEEFFFPADLSLIFLFGEEKFTINFNFSRLEFNTKVTPNFKISPKYKEIESKEN